MIYKGSNPIAELQKAGEQLMHEKSSPDYGQIFLKEDGSGQVWYVLADGDGREDEERVKELLLAIEGIDEITCEAEGYPPRGEGWIQVFPREKEWKSFLVDVSFPKILDVSNVQQEFNYDCGPASTAMVMQFFGKPKTPAELARLMGTDVNNGTDPAAICHVLNQAGFNYDDTGSLTIQDLQIAIEKGSPVIVAIQDYEEQTSDIVMERVGHWVVVVGADEEYVYIQDPSAVDLVVMPALEFLARWQDYAGIVPDRDMQYIHYGITVSGPMQAEESMSKDMLPGGLADDVSGEVDPEQLAIGIQVEMEHTDDPAIAEEIARDHLSEDAEYYSKLQTMESKAMETDYGIIEDDDGFWVVEGDNAERVYGPYDTREEASQIMQEVEQENKSVKDRMGIGGQFILVGDDISGWRVTDWDGMPETDDVFASRAEAQAWLRQSGRIKSTEVEKATVQPYEGGRWIVVGSRGQMVAGPYDTELEALQASSQISMGFGTIRSHFVNKATMITQNQDDPLTGMTTEGRPVRFSESMWVWIYDDTPGEDAVEKVEDAQLIRSHFVNKATMITQNQDDPLTGMTTEGRPVRFSESMWVWIYDDTPGEDAVEKVEDAQLIRSYQMDINDIALQFCGLLSIGKKASPEIMGMLRKELEAYPMSDDDVREQGRLAAQQGDSPESNPYPFGTSERSLWDQGYADSAIVPMAEAE